MDDTIKTLIQIVSPFIGAALGVFLVPLIEKRKSNQQINELIDNYKEELSDIELQASDAAKSLHQAYLDLEKYNNGELTSVMFHGLTKIETYFIEDTLKKAYSKISHDERKALKALKFMINEFNTINANIVAQILTHSQEINFKKPMSYAVDIYWICNRINSTTVFKYAPNHSNEIEHQKALAALHIPSI
ncbi:hypothetical protein [Tolumonas auensis]|uniref:hypothetical protein n=1 Tax=Tolumonas auensis TaxID=43948 RepID=UPI002AA84415|nr:hypothetical protein [Tolumonas auensis]